MSAYRYTMEAINYGRPFYEITPGSPMLTPYNPITLVKLIPMRGNKPLHFADCDVQELLQRMIQREEADTQLGFLQFAVYKT